MYAERMKQTRSIVGATLQLPMAVKPSKQAGLGQNRPMGCVYLFGPVVEDPEVYVQRKAASVIPPSSTTNKSPKYAHLSDQSPWSGAYARNVSNHNRTHGNSNHHPS